MHLPESELKTIQRVASCYTDYPGSYQMIGIRTSTLLKSIILREVSQFHSVLHHLTKKNSLKTNRCFVIIKFYVL